MKLKHLLLSALVLLTTTVTFAQEEWEPQTFVTGYVNTAAEYTDIDYKHYWNDIDPAIGLSVITSYSIHYTKLYEVGDEVTVLPSGFSSKVKSINLMDEQLEYAFAPQSVALTLEDDIDISRGDMLVKTNNGQPQVGQDVDVMLCWFNERKLIPRGKYVLRHTSAEARCMVKDIQFKMNINTLEKDLDDKDISMNDIAKVSLRVTKPLFFDSYNVNRITGSFRITSYNVCYTKLLRIVNYLHKLL